MPNVQLNARYLATLKPDPVRRVEVTDTDARGLVFRITPSGARSWCLRISVDGAKFRETLGEYPQMSLASARKAAAAMRARIKSQQAQGIDPADLQTTEETVITTRVALDKYYELHVDPTIVRPEERKSIMENALAGYLKKPVKSIKHSDLFEVLQNKRLKHPVAANRWRGAIKHFFGWCKNMGYTESHTAVDLPKPTKSELPRSRVLTIEEMRRIYEVCDDEGDDFGLFTQFLILTAQRRQDVAGATWDQFSENLSMWYIPPRIKSKKSRCTSRAFVNSRAGNFTSTQGYREK